jgi:prophage maintenance system killer protein
MKLSEKMKRSKFKKHGSQMILELDLNGIDLYEDYDEVIKYFVDIVERMPKKSVSCLIDMTKVNRNEFLQKKIKDIYRYCSTQLNRSAMIADDEFRPMLEPVASVFNTIKTTHIFSDINAARNYLVNS